MVRARHPKKDIEAALRRAELQGWRVEQSSGTGHAWGRLYCQSNDQSCRNGEFCVFSVYGTPRNPFSHASQIRRIVDSCAHRCSRVPLVNLQKAR
jgi:hypothetical protein